MTLRVVQDTTPPSWLTVAEAEELTGFSRRELGRLVDAGRLRKRRGKPKDGARRVWLYSEEDCARVADSVDDLQSIQETEASKTIAELRRVIQDLQEPNRLYLEALKEELQARRAREGQLEAMNLTLVATREAMLSEQLTRDLETKDFDRKQKRKDDALKLAMGQVSRLFGASPEAKLLQSVTEEQIEILVTAGILTTEQQTLAQTVLDRRRAKSETVEATAVHVEEQGKAKAS